MNNVAYQDIHNKVTAVRGYSQLALNAETEAECRLFLEKEDHILASIQVLIGKTKDYQKMGLNLPRWIELGLLVQKQAALNSGLAGIAVDIDLHGLECYTDPEIEQVFYQLIGNSVKHAKNLTRISVSCRETPENIVIVYEDDGVGVPAEKKTRIFDRVVSGEGKFGLFFIYEFLGLSGMGIAETGVYGEGARFEITVPKGKCRFGSVAVPADDS